MLPRVLFLFALFLLVFCSGVLYLLKEHSFYVKIFIFFFSVSMGFFAVVYFLESNVVNANFFLGVMSGIVVLVPFRALPFIEGWTRSESFLQHVLGFPLHLSLIHI